MKVSPLQLEIYFLSDLHLTVNKSYNPQKEPELVDADLSVNVEYKRDPESERNWQLIMKLKNQPAAEANVPYIFSVEIVGFFRVLEGYPADKLERLVKTNGATMLFGVLREVVRDLTSRGPYATLILPSASFYEEPPQQEPKA